MPTTQPSPLSDRQIATLENAASKLENIGNIFAGDKESRRLGKELRALLAALSVPVSESMTGFWLDSHDDGDGWRDISCAQHGGFMRIVWTMEDDERSPECEARAKWVIEALNAYSVPPQAIVAQPVDAGAVLISEIAKQTPEKPDYWSSCGQCERNIEAAKDILEAPQINHAGAKHE